MYLPTEQPPGFVTLSTHAREIIGTLCQRLPINGVERTIPAQTSLDFFNPEARLFVILEGTMTLSQHDRVLCFFEQSDLLGLGHLAYSELGKVSADFAVRLVEYRAQEFIDAIWTNPSSSKLWHEYTNSQSALMTLALASCLRSEVRLAPEIITIEAGSTIIQQGALADKVFTILEGSCSVIVDGKKVAELGPDEIFGAIAVAIDAPRSATVQALTRTVVMAVTKDKFLQLIECRPATTLRLIQDLSRSIINLNGQLVRGG